MVKLLLFLLLACVCWPLALVAVVLYPVAWLVSLPFRLMGRAVRELVELALSILLLPVRIPARVLRAI
jgi:hypothetical protein